MAWLPAKQSLGQNFLMHQATADRIAESADIKGKTVLEIGAGTGMLTRALLRHAGKVIALETDRALIPGLEETFSAELAGGKLELLQGDIRTFDFSKMPSVYSVVANIPYYITGEIIRIVLSAANKPESVTFLVQKEVAERVARDAKESLLSLSVKVYGHPKHLFTVPRGAFRPAPKVDSAVLTIASISTPFANESQEARFFEILHAGFAHKRKQLAKNLEAVMERDQVARAFTEASLRADVRAEDVPLSAWKTIAGIA